MGTNMAKVVITARKIINQSTDIKKGKRALELFFIVFLLALVVYTSNFIAFTRFNKTKTGGE
jgi:hypothetical protein